MLRYIFIAAVAVFVIFHFYPKQTIHTAHKLADKSYRAAKEFVR